MKRGGRLIGNEGEIIFLGPQCWEAWTYETGGRVQLPGVFKSRKTAAAAVLRTKRKPCRGCGKTPCRELEYDDPDYGL